MMRSTTCMMVMVLLTMAFASPSAVADLLPLAAGVVHYDPLAPPAYFPFAAPGLWMPGPPAGADGLVAGQWIWESELHVPPGTPGPAVIGVDFVIAGAGGGLVMAVGGMMPAGGAGGASRLFAVHFHENLLPPPGGIHGGGADVGALVIGASRRLGGPAAMDWGMSVVEPEGGQPGEPGEEDIGLDLPDGWSAEYPDWQSLTLTDLQELGIYEPGVYMSVVPEPASLTLLALGGVLIGRRR